MSNVTRNYKDNVFCIMYREKKHLLSLYNAMNGTSYEDEGALEVVTLDGAICMKVKNDVAFVIDSRLNLYEQQSTDNPNMPLRDLYYVAEELKRIAPPGSLYGTKRVTIPAPRFIVFYNGPAKQDESKVYRLSDLFEGEENGKDGERNGEPELELKVTVLNINHGHNEALLERCESLRGYMAFVEKVRGKSIAGVPLEAAVSEAVDQCISEGILADFFREHREEIVEMGIFEFDQELHDQALREDGYEKGETIGYEKGEAAGYEKGEAAGYEKGEAAGYEKGETIGYEKGETAGIEKCRLICQQIHSGNTDSEAIAKVCGCSAEEVEEVRWKFMDFFKV